MIPRTICKRLQRTGVESNNERMNCIMAKTGTRKKEKAPAKETTKKAPASAKETKPKAAAAVKARESDQDFLARQREELKEAKTQKGDFWKLKDGSAIARIFMFSHEGRMEVFARETRHWSVEGKNKGQVTCPEEDCPLCDLFQEDKKQYNDIRPQTNYLVNAVIRKLENGKDKQVIATFPKTAYAQIMDLMVSEDPNVLVPDVFDLDNGTDIKIVKKKEGAIWRYTIVAMPQSSRIGMDVTPVNLFEKVRPAPDHDTLQELADALR